MGLSRAEIRSSRPLIRPGLVGEGALQCRLGDPQAEHILIDRQDPLKAELDLVEHGVPGIVVDTDREGYQAVEKRSSQGEVVQIALHETDGISEGKNGLPVYRLGQIDPHRVHVEPESVRAYPLQLQVHEIRQSYIREECREVVIVQKKEVVGVGDEGKIVCVEIVPER